MNTYLPKAVYSNHNIIQQDHNLVCITPDCKFTISVEQAKHYIKQKEYPAKIISNIVNNEVKNLKLRVIDNLKSEITAKGLVQKEAIEFLTPFLTAAIIPNHGYEFFDINEKLIEKNIDRLNQICPFTAENFENDFRAKKYIDKSKLICTVSANDFTSESVDGFLTRNFDKIKSFLNYIFSKNFSNEVESFIQLAGDGGIMVTLNALQPGDLLEKVLHREDLKYSKTYIESGANGSDVFKNLEKAAIIDSAIVKFKFSNFAAFCDRTNTYINNWSLAENSIDIIHCHNDIYSKINIDLTSVVDIEQCEINIEKFKEILEKEGIQYADLINETLRKGEGRIVVD
jgi:hypothetical protein